MPLVFSSEGLSAVLEVGRGMDGKGVCQRTQWAPTHAEAKDSFKVKVTSAGSRLAEKDGSVFHLEYVA